MPVIEKPTVTTEKPTVTLEQVLADAPELAALPQVVMRVIDLTANLNTTASDVEKVISLDQALAAKILALANSSYYGLPRRLSSLREAVVFLGFKTVRNMAMAITTFSVFLGKADALSLTRRALWRHSIDTAQCARVITTRLPAHVQESFGSDEAFTCGLLHDIGKMLLDGGVHDAYLQTIQWASAQKVRFHEIEDDFLPFGHSPAGAALAGRWNLPAVVCEAISCHHTPAAAEVNPRLTCAVALANEIAHFWEAGGVDEEGLRERVKEMLGPLRLTDESLPGLTAACRTELDKGLAAFSFG